MSLYNLLHGQNPMAPILKAVLGIDQERSKYESGRFRDIYLNEKGTAIVLYTRNGGGNREEYQPLIDVLATHPNYIEDHDDDFDCTYAYITFSIPEEAKGLCASLATGEKPKTIHEKFTETISAMEKMKPEELKNDKRFSPIIAMFDEITKEVKK